jgi:putative oxidoreductase
MDRWLGRHAERAYALFRFVAGVLFACHGAQKLFGVLGGKVMTSQPLYLTAGVIELAGGILIAVGLLASWAAFVASGLMAAAYFMAHAPQGFWPIQNKGELAALYCFAFLYVATRGSGRYSLDARMHRRPGRP